MVSPVRSRLVAVLLGGALLTTACGLKPEVADTLAQGGSARAGGGSGLAAGDDLVLEGGEAIDPATGEVVDPGVVEGGATGTEGATGGDAGTATGSTGGTAPGTGGGTTAPQTGTGGAVTKGTTTGITDSEILIGVHAPLSGASPLPQGSFDNGAKKYWAGKKIFGRSVRVITRDDKYTPSGAVRACEELARETFVVFGAAGTDQIQACGRNRLLQSTNTPYLSSGVTENGLRGIPTYFASSLTYKQQSPIVLKNAQAQGFADDGKWALVLSDTPNFADARDSMSQVLKAAGIPFDYIPVPKAGTDSDATRLASQLRAGGYPVVYFLGQPFFFAKVVQQAQGPGYAPTWTGPGPSMAVNSVLSLTCGSPYGFKGAYLSPYHGLDKAPAGTYADDIEMVTAGSMQGLEFMLNKLTAETLNRESMLALLRSGIKLPAGIFPPADFSRGQFAGTAVYALNADCGSRTWKTHSGPIAG